MSHNFPVEFCQAVNSHTPGGVTHVGVVIRDVHGNVLMSQHTPPSHGVSCTFPRGARNPIDSAITALDRALRERAGIGMVSAYPLGNVWVTENSSTCYFVGLVASERPMPTTEIADATWFTPEAAAERLAESKNVCSRRRDLLVLEHALRVVPTAARRVALMHLHLLRLGFARLRLLYEEQHEPGPSLGQMRFTLMPVSVAASHHPMLADAHLYNSLRYSAGLSEQDVLGCWSNGLQPPFGWKDAYFDTPEQLAQKYLTRFRELCLTGWGPDESYSDWLRNAVEVSEPFGVIVPAWNDSPAAAVAYSPHPARLPPPPRVGA